MPRAKKQIVDLELVRGPILQTWGEIAYDLEQGIRESGERLTNAIAIESCIDADRLTFHAHRTGLEEAKAADAEIRRAIKEHGYPTVLRSLSARIHLV